MSEEEKKTIDTLLEKIDFMIKEVDAEIDKTKAKAYGTDIRDYYAIVLRDEFNKLEGERNALVKTKNKTLEIIKGE